MLLHARCRKTPDSRSGEPDLGEPGEIHAARDRAAAARASPQERLSDRVGARNGFDLRCRRMNSIAESARRMGENGGREGSAVERHAAWPTSRTRGGVSGAGFQNARSLI